MEPIQRTFDLENDYDAVCSFLTACYEPLNRDGNWIRPIWDCSCFHPLMEPDTLGKTGLWLQGDEVVGVTIFDVNVNDVCLCAMKTHKYLKPDILFYAEENLSKEDSVGTSQLNVFAHDFDEESEHLLRESGYTRRSQADRTFCYWEIPTSLPVNEIREGFAFMSLEEENDLQKINRVLYRGFDHPGEPPEEDIELRKKMQSCPNFRFDLTLVAKAPSGDYATFCGLWFDESNRYCYVEPVATDPSYRSRGLGKATVIEGLRRARLSGAEIAYVWSDTKFYRSIGFEPLNDHHCWTKIISHANGT